MGLSLPLDKFSFHYPNKRAVEIVIDEELRDDAARWQFWQFRPTPEYLVAICAERAGAESPNLIVRRTVPMLSDEPFAPEFLRTNQYERRYRWLLLYFPDRARRKKEWGRGCSTRSVNMRRSRRTLTQSSVIRCARFASKPPRTT